MKDINGIEIQAGDLVKKQGVVKYATAPREKLSKKTWVATEQDGVLGLFLGDWEPFRDHTQYLIVGSTKKGMDARYQALSKITVSTVFEKYRLKKDVPEKSWKAGEVVRTNGKVKKDDDTFEWVAENVPHQHVLIVVDPIKINLIKNGE